MSDSSRVEDLLEFNAKEGLKQEQVDQWHHNMLNDSKRNKVYKMAIERLVSEECQIVLDIGSGSGLLSFMVLMSSSATRVVACEVNPFLTHLIKDVVRREGEGSMTSRLRVITKLSTALDLQGDLQGCKVHRVVTETFDAGLLGEHVLEALDHAHKNLIHDHPNDHEKLPRVLPAVARLYCSGLRSDLVSREYFWSDLMSEELLNEPYDSVNLNTLSDHTLVTLPKLICEVNFDDKREVERLLTQSNYFDVQLELVDKKDDDLVEINAILVWFELDMLGDRLIVLSTKPNDDFKSCWEQALFPIPSMLISSKEKFVSLRFEIAGALRLISLQNACIKSFKCAHKCFPAHFIAMLNDKELMSAQAKEAEHLLRSSDDTQKCPITVIETTLIAQVGLRMLQSDSSKVIRELKLCNCHTKTLLNTALFVHRWCLKNKMAMDNIGSVDDLDDLDINIDDSNQKVILIWDPVLRNGHLNEMAIKRARLIRDKFPHLLTSPVSVTICCQLVSSVDLVHRCRINPSRLHLKSSSLAANLASSMDTLGSLHLLDLQMSTEINFDTLSPTVRFESIDLLDNTLVRKERTTSTTSKGKVEALLYWHELNYASGAVFSTLCGLDEAEMSSGQQHRYYRQAAFMVEQCFHVDAGAQVDLQCELFKGKLRITAKPK